MSRSKYGYDRDNRSPPRYYDRDDDGRQDTSEGRHSDEEDSVKPYTAVGATLDSAQRFKRRMNYGRANPRVEEKENSDRNDGREPGYMRTTEAYSKRSSRSKSPDLRQKYPHWYEDDRDNERNDSARGRSPEQGDRYGRQESPKKYGMGFPSRRRNSEPREQYSRDRFSPGAKERFSPRRKSADRESIYNQSLDRDRRSPERNQKSRGRFSPDQYKRSPERNGSDYYRRRSPERVPTGKDDYSRRSPERREESPKKEERKYGRSSSAESFQTVKIKKSDLNEIRRKYELKLKQNVIESAKSQAYRYSSNMRNSSEPSSSDGKQSKPSTSSFSRSKSESRDKVRKKREWRNPDSNQGTPDSSGGSSKLTPHERYARRKSYDASRSRSTSPMPDISRVRSSGYGPDSGYDRDNSESRERSYQGRRATDSRGRSFQLLPSVD